MSIAKKIMLAAAFPALAFALTACSDQKANTAKPTVAKTETKAPAKAEAKPAVKAPAKAEAKPAVKAPAKAEAKPADKAPAKAEAKPADKAPAKAEAKPAVKAPAKAEAKPAVKAPAKAEAKPAPKTIEQTLAFLPPVIAEGTGIKITKEQLIKEVAMQIPPQALSEIPEAKLKDLIRNMAKGMIDRELLSVVAQKNGYKPSAKLVVNEIDKGLAQLPKEKMDQLEAQFKMQGKTLDSYKQEVAKDPMAQKGAALSKFVKDKIEPKCKVSDEEAEKFYRENQNRFEIPEEIAASHILIKVEAPAGKEKDKEALEKVDKEALAKAAAILAQLRQGADFEKMAEKESDCPSGKSAKGSLGKFKRGSMVPEFEKAAFALNKGELSGVVKTQFGYHIIKVTDKIPASHQSFEKVKANIKSYLALPKIEKMLKELLEKERAALNVKVANF